MKRFALLCAILLAGLSVATAQTPLLCDHQNVNSYCEIREMNLPFAGAVDIRTGGVGAITVKGWDNGYVFVRSHVTAQADDEYQARLVAAAVAIDTPDGRVWASGPTGKSWVVSYEVFVPRECGLRLETHVGAISITEVTGTIRAVTSVGAIALAGVAGDVQGSTSVGAISATLAGAGWAGKGLDLTTSTGAIRLTAGADYSAEFRLTTALGGIATNFPGARVTALGFLGRKLVFEAGSGGASIRAATNVGQIELAAVARQE